MTAVTKNAQNVSDKLATSPYMGCIRSKLFDRVEQYEDDAFEMFTQVQPTMVSMTEPLSQHLVDPCLDTH
jgi:hypothetical protein